MRVLKPVCRTRVRSFYLAPGVAGGIYRARQGVGDLTSVLHSRPPMDMSMNMIEIREATVEDLQAMARVHIRADWETYAPLFGATAYRLEVVESEQRWRRALEGDGLLLIAADQGAVVGLGHAAADRIDGLYLLP